MDFLEIHENLYAIGALLKEIHDKLDKGICIVAIQKKPGASVGYGGVFSLEKPRLYISLDSGKLEIVKAKNWRDETVNPNGLRCKFSLAAGCKFYMDSQWYREGDNDPS